MAFGKKTDRAGLQAVLELKNVDYSKDPEIQQLYTRLVNGRSQFGQILAKNASASLQIAEVVDALKDYNSKMESVSQQIAQASEDATQSASESSRVAGEVSNQHDQYDIVCIGRICSDLQKHRRGTAGADGYPRSVR